MFYLHSENQFYINIISNTLSQKSNLFTNNQNKKNYGTIDFTFDQSSLVLNLEKEYIKMKLPMSFYNLFSAMIELTSTYAVNFGGFKYLPIKQIMILDDQKLKLNNLHNLIMNQLFLYRDGVNKVELYKHLWPNDKEVYINKLDTHLTNLKNYLGENLKFNFVSNKGILRLVVD